MQCLFLGGQLDGELRDIGTTVDGFRFVGGYAGHDRVPSGYHIANGIARHESVGEEEVARRVHRWRNPVQFPMGE